MPSLPVINSHAAGVDIGSSSIYISVPSDSSPTPIAQYGCFTPDLLEATAWLKECGVRTVAMESTGVYWIPFYEILEQHGFDVMLISPNYPKKDRKTDVEDCQWLQYLHSVGLLKGSFRPPETVCAIRAILRHRATLVQEASADVQRMQKSLIQMNLLLHNVISDITGTTGLAIIDAILLGNRDPKYLAQYRNYRIKATTEEIEKSLVGNYRSEHLFTLKQSRQAYQFHQQQIAECDAQIEQMLKDIDGKPPLSPPSKTGRSRTGKNDIVFPHLDLRSEMTRIYGVDLTQIPGLGPNTVCAIFTEIGFDISKFASSFDFCSWLKLCPEPKISGGRVLGKAARTPKPRLSILLRVAAQSLERSDTYLGAFYRRMKARFGAPSAVKATAHKIARIIYAMITTKEPYDEGKFDIAQEKFNQRRINRLHKEAAALGYTLASA